MNEPVDGVEMVFETDNDYEELMNSIEPKMTAALLSEPVGKIQIGHMSYL